MTILSRIDEFLLDRVYQPIIDLFSQRTGIGIIAIAEFLFVGMLAAWTIVSGCAVLYPPIQWFINSMLVAVWAMGAFMFGAATLLRIKETKQYLRDGYLNKGRINFFISRVGYLLMTPIWFIPSFKYDLLHILHDIAGATFALTVTSAHYVLSCQPGPPRVRRTASKLAHQGI